mmetsp:Transcript_6998/g.17920  ORF Transcript_6998/g.17920 Transcript_6998/m.17920 type:complete len:124 (+) Transcript_6998:82-453(+)
MAESNPMHYLGEVILVPYTFAPKGFMPVNGTMHTFYNSGNDATEPAGMSNMELASLLGTNWGGEVGQTFQLPNLPPVCQAGEDADAPDSACLHWVMKVADGVFPGHQSGVYVDFWDPPGFSMD